MSREDDDFEMQIDSIEKRKLIKFSKLGRFLTHSLPVVNFNFRYNYCCLEIANDDHNQDADDFKFFKAQKY